MKRTILHLYHDVMNLYGENGNIRVLTRHLKDQGAEVEVLCSSLGESHPFEKADFIYMGCGTERNQLLALEDLAKQSEAFGKALERKTVTLFTGNAFHLIGQSITDAAGQTHEGLGIYPFTVTLTDKRRYTNDALATCEWTNTPIVGFLNKCAQIEGITFPLFQMQMGQGNAADDRREGIHFTSFYGTQLSGPLLYKNPAFLKFLVKEICKSQEGYVYKEVSYPYEEAAYETTLASLKERFASGNGEQEHH